MDCFKLVYGESVKLTCPRAGDSEDAVHCCGPSWQRQCCTAAELGLSDHTKIRNSDDFRNQISVALDSAWFMLLVPLMAITIILLCCCCFWRLALKGCRLGGAVHHPPPPPPAQPSASVLRTRGDSGAYQMAPLPPPARSIRTRAAVPSRATVDPRYQLEPKAGPPSDVGGNSYDEPPSYADLYPSSQEAARQPAYNPYAP